MSPRRGLGILLAASTALFTDACSDSDPDATPGGADGGPGGLPGTGSGDGGTGTQADGATTPPITDPTPSVAGTSCVDLPTTCGGSKNCCTSNRVVGGTFKRSHETASPATVSDFRLDVYEVTLGRFRKFVDAGKGTQASPPAAGDGAHPKIASSGWDPAFNSNLAPTTAALKAALKCNPTYPIWTDSAGANETLPMNCVTWFDALAFCGWDGGRLPTEAEWNYAAAGGSEQREFPWGANLDATRAVYNCTGDGSGAGACALSDVLPVGSKSPAGDGRWGQADLAGSVWELVLDWYQATYRLTSCTDCAELQPSSTKVFRGGAFPNDEAYFLRTATRFYDSALDRDKDVGFRCARAL